MHAGRKAGLIVYRNQNRSTLSFNKSLYIILLDSYLLLSFYRTPNGQYFDTSWKFFNVYTDL